MSYMHYFKWNTGLGKWTRNAVTWAAVKMMRAARRMLRWSLGRCSWCGGNPGFSSSISRKGLRCATLDRKCEQYP